MAQQDLTEWDDDLTVSAEEEYAALLRAIRWAKGFGLLFVQCSPAEGTRLIERTRADVAQKTVAVLELNEAITDLHATVAAYPDIEQTQVLFIRGLEQSLVPYIKPGYGSEGDYYAKDTVPKLLGKLNLQRERFKADFPVCFVFLVPRYAMKYLIRRAADFFDWRSGVWEFVPPQEEQQQTSARLLQEGAYQKYLSWTHAQRRQRVLEIYDLLTQPEALASEASALYVEQGNLLLADQDFATAIAAYDAALALQPDDPTALYNKGIALSNLGRYEVAIAAYDAALALQPDAPSALNNKGYALSNLGRYEAAIAAYDAALALQSDDPTALNNKGLALRN
ncbi:MAG: tetratricopeptide repeat protein [Cyanobacteria bacterium P01_F01_bin.86]